MVIQSNPTLVSRPAADIWNDFYALPAEQQPGWADSAELASIRATLAVAPPLVELDQVDALRLLLADVAAGRLQVIQAGDCAEDPADNTPRKLSRKIGLLRALAGTMRANTGKPVLCVGRIAGQFAKPRSRPTERVNGFELPSYRGPMVNHPEPRPEARRADPLRMLTCHHSAATTMRYLNGSESGVTSPLLWTSHEALALDYELPQLRCREDGRLTLTSTHWPWMGERTRQPYGAHAALLAAISNPVASKIGPETELADVLELCERLDPHRQPGRLTLIARMGADRTLETLPRLVSAVRRAGYPVIWLCDPMHANTVTTPSSRKTRLVSTLVREVDAFQRAVLTEGGVAGGLHLEVTPDAVTECVSSEAEIAQVGSEGYTTLCDPRLNPQQALHVASAWTMVPFAS